MESLLTYFELWKVPSLSLSYTSFTKCSLNGISKGYIFNGECVQQGVGCRVLADLTGSKTCPQSEKLPLETSLKTLTWSWRSLRLQTCPLIPLRQAHKSGKNTLHPCLISAHKSGGTKLPLSPPRDPSQSPPQGVDLTSAQRARLYFTLGWPLCLGLWPTLGLCLPARPTCPSVSKADKLVLFREGESTCGGGGDGFIVRCTCTHTHRHTGLDCVQTRAHSHFSH